MDNTTALHEFEPLRVSGDATPSARFAAAKHYLSDLRQFRKVCAKPWAEVTPQDVDAFMEYGQEHGWKPATLTRRAAALRTCFEFWAVETNTLEPLRVTRCRRGGMPPSA